MCLIYTSLFPALFGVLFADTQEAAFASQRMLQCLGLALAFGYSHVLCVRTKVYVMGSVSLVALALYGVVELSVHKQGPRKSSRDTTLL